MQRSSSWQDADKYLASHQTASLWFVTWLTSMCPPAQPEQEFMIDARKSLMFQDNYWKRLISGYLNIFP